MLTSRFENVEHLEDVMTTPSPALVTTLRGVPGDILVLGVGGKMGPTLARLAKRAAPGKRVIGVARFSEPGLKAALEQHGIECIVADLLSREQLAALPDVPTISEAGVPGYEAANWWGIVGPVGLPPAIIKRLHGETAAILKTPEILKWFASEGAEVADMTTEQFAKYIVTESAKWRRVAKEVGLKPE